MLTAAVASLIASWALLLGAGSLNDLIRVIRRRRFRHSAGLLTRVMFGSEADAAAAAEALTRMPRPLLIRGLQSLSTDVSGDARDRLKRLVHAVGLRGFILRRSRSRLSWRRRVQAAELAHLLPGGDPLHRRLLRDGHPMVRARSMDGMEADEVIAEVDSVMALLRDGSELVRASAQRAVLAADSRIVPHVIAALREPGDTAVLTLLAVAANLPDPRLADAVSEHVVSSDPLRRALVAEALGGMRGARGAPVLRGLLGDEDPRVRRAAAAAVGATGAVALAGRAGHLLADPDWDVRSAAARSLAELGPVGWMVLRTALWSPSADAAAIARQELDKVAATRAGAVALGPEQLAAFGESLDLGAAA